MKRFITFHSTLDIYTCSCYALFQNVLHCLKQMASPFDLFLSLAAPLSQVYIPCRTAIVLANEEIDYCDWNTISDSRRDGNPAHFWDSTLPPFTACLPSSFRKPAFTRQFSTYWFECLLSHFCSSHCSQIIDYQELVSQYPTAKLS